MRAIGAAYKMIEAEDMGAEEQAASVRLPGGSYIRAIAARPETARGMSDNLILDEFAHHKDNRALWRALVPVVSRPDLKLRVISTPNGVGDMFHEIMTADDGLFSRHIVTIHDAVADGLPRNIDELKKAARDPDTWAQEYECTFLDTAGREWLTYEEILATLEAPPLPPYDGRPVYVGMDIAARGDLSVIAVLGGRGRRGARPARDAGHARGELRRAAGAPGRRDAAIPRGAGGHRPDRHGRDAGAGGAAAAWAIPRFRCDLHAGFQAGHGRGAQRPDAGQAAAHA
ncbi:terminase family protein [Thermomonas sp. S9]|uniref:terminase large subunit domain-containing protein n=1 Tax=Thermomonas sp. S9 TaxID=2885203 RepID=UPI00216AB43B|nr:terminase family protein [Thermomonas sp. S9]